LACFLHVYTIIKLSQYDSLKPRPSSVLSHFIAFYFFIWFVAHKARGACNYYLDELPTPTASAEGSARGVGGSRNGSAKSSRQNSAKGSRNQKGNSRTSSAAKARTVHTPSAATIRAATAASAATAPVLDPQEPLWWLGKPDTEERGLMTEAEEAALHLGWQRTSAGHVSKAALNRDVPPHLKLRVIEHATLRTLP